MKLQESSCVVKMTATVTGGGGGPDLSAYPHLVCAPAQWGEGIRCASNGAEVVKVACYVGSGPIAWAAESFKVTLDEAFEAYKYATANGLI